MLSYVKNIKYQLLFLNHEFRFRLGNLPGGLRCASILFHKGVWACAASYLLFRPDHCCHLWHSSSNSHHLVMAISTNSNPRSFLIGWRVSHLFHWVGNNRCAEERGGITIGVGDDGRCPRTLSTGIRARTGKRERRRSSEIPSMKENRLIVWAHTGSLKRGLISL